MSLLHKGPPLNDSQLITWNWEQNEISSKHSFQPSCSETISRNRTVKSLVYYLKWPNCWQSSGLQVTVPPVINPPTWSAQTGLRLLLPQRDSPLRAHTPAARGLSVALRTRDQRSHSAGLGRRAQTATPALLHPWQCHAADTPGRGLM